MILRLRLVSRQKINSSFFKLLQYQVPNVCWILYLNFISYLFGSVIAQKNSQQKSAEASLSTETVWAETAADCTYLVLQNTL